MSNSHRSNKKRKRQGEQEFLVQNFAAQQRAKREYARQTGDLSVLASPNPIHYHLMWNAIPNRAAGWETQGMAFREIGRIRDVHEQKVGEDKVRYFENDEGMIELQEVVLPGRTGKHNVMVQVCACPQRCPNIQKVREVQARIN